MLEVNTLSSLETRLGNNKLVVVDFYAKWCGPCKMMAPILDELSALYLNDVEFIKVNIDETPTLTQHFSIMSIPTLLFFKDGLLVDSLNGFQVIGNIKKKIIKYL